MPALRVKSERTLLTGFRRQSRLASPPGQGGGTALVLDVDEATMALNRAIAGWGGSALLRGLVAGLGGAVTLSFGTLPAVGNYQAARSTVRRCDQMRRALQREPRSFGATRRSWLKNRRVVVTTAAVERTRASWEALTSVLSVWGTAGMGLSVLAGLDFLGALVAPVTLAVAPLLWVSVPAVVLFGLATAALEMRDIVDAARQSQTRARAVRRRQQAGKTPLQAAWLTMPAAETQLRQQVCLQQTLRGAKVVTSASLAVGVAAVFAGAAPWALGVMVFGALGAMGNSYLQNLYAAAPLRASCVLDIGGKRHAVWEVERQTILQRTARQMRSDDTMNMASRHTGYAAQSVRPSSMALVKAYWGSYVQQRLAQLTKMVAALDDLRHPTMIAFRGEQIRLRIEAARLRQPPTHCGNMEILWSVISDSELYAPFIDLALRRGLIQENGILHPRDLHRALAAAEPAYLGKLYDCARDVIVRNGEAHAKAAQRAFLAHLQGRLVRQRQA